jgi:hypothetical protein
MCDSVYFSKHFNYFFYQHMFFSLELLSFENYQTLNNYHCFNFYLKYEISLNYQFCENG